MADDADRAGDNTDKFEAAAIKAISGAAKHRDLRPIIQVLDGKRFGICHYCESPIRPGNLFCDPDREEPEHSCSVESEHERKRKEAMGL